MSHTDDTRITCLDCKLLTAARVCRAAIERARTDVAADYHPIVDLPMHCGWFVPKPDDPDQRPGRVRFPGVWARDGGAAGADVSERIRRLRERLA